jgi:hypothetical protein
MSEGFPKLYIVWKGDLKQIDKPIFSTGDAFVLDDDKTIYIWLGIYCSVDEKGAAAIQSQKLDKDRAGASKIVTIDQGSETPEFLETVNKMGGTMRLVEKNFIGSMLKDVDTGTWAGHMEHVNALYRVSSEEFEGDLNAMKFLQVPFEKESLDEEDVFIADLGDEILVWVGSTSNAKEKVMAGKWARQFDVERAGYQKITYYNEGEDAEFVDKCWGKGIVKTSSKMAQIALEKAGAAIASATKDEGVQLFDEPEAAAPKPAPAPTPAPVAAPRPAEPKALAGFMADQPKASQVKLEHAPKPAPVVTAFKAEAPKAAAPPKAEAAPAAEPAVSEGGARWVCPHCGNNDRRMIRELVDKTVLLNAYPPIYGKKLNCGKCGKEWRHK